MKKLFQTLGFCCALAVQTPVFASSDMRVNVPFSFVVAGKELKPGNYVVKEDSQGVVLVQGHGGAAFAVTVPAARAGTAPSLRFTNSNQVEYLVGVDMGGTQTRAIPLPAAGQHRLSVSR